MLAYEDLLAVFWGSHRPTSPPHSRQYASMIFTLTPEEAAAAVASKRALESRFGPLYTEIVPAGRFYAAEDYHQKYYLRNTERLYREFRRTFGNDEVALRESTAAARVNGYLGDPGGAEDLASGIGSYGLSAEGAEYLRTRIVGARPPAAGVR